MGEETIKEGKLMTAITAPNIRQLVDIANEVSISREDIISIIPSNEGYTLIYYYGEE